jgi:hypothetical protein
MLRFATTRCLRSRINDVLSISNYFNNLTILCCCFRTLIELYFGPHEGRKNIFDTFKEISNYLDISDNWDGASELLVHHKSENTHHGGTAVVKLNGTLLKLGLFIKLVPSEVNESVTEVTDEFISGSWDVLHDEQFKETNKAENLNSSPVRDRVRAEEGGKSIGVGVEAVSSVIDGSSEVNTSTGDDVSKEGKLGNTSVLDLNETKTVETLLVGTVKKSKRIEESKRRLDTELILEGVEGGGGLAGLGRGEGGGGGDSGGKDDGLHGELLCRKKLWIVQRSMQP